MGGLVKNLFGDPAGDAAKASAAQATAQLQASTISQQRQQQAAVDSGTTTGDALAATFRQPRGSRLLTSAQDGGLAQTLGQST